MTKTFQWWLINDPDGRKCYTLPGTHINTTMYKATFPPGQKDKILKFFRQYPLGVYDRKLGL